MIKARWVASTHIGERLERLIGKGTRHKCPSSGWMEQGWRMNGFKTMLIIQDHKFTFCCKEKKQDVLSPSSPQKSPKGISILSSPLLLNSCCSSLLLDISWGSPCQGQSCISQQCTLIRSSMATSPAAVVSSPTTAGGVVEVKCSPSSNPWQSNYCISH